MNNPLVKKTLPHVIALLIFLIVSILFCKPVLDGLVLSQHDNIGWKGMAQNAFEYKEKTGHFPLWNPNLFSGMPNYQVAMEGKSILPDTVKILSLGMPKPINFFFLACVFFYILCISLRVHPVVGMISGLAYSFSTYNPVLVAAGHDTQMLATAFLPLMLAGLINIYEKRYWIGFGLTVFGTFQQIGANHLQVTYYLLIIALLMTIGFLVKWIREKDWKHIGIAGALAITAGIIGVAGNALTLKTTSEYSKYTMRGGKDLEITADSVKAVKTAGLDTFYAFEYSLSKAESFTLLMPDAMGGGSKERLSANSAVASKLKAKGVDETNASQVAESLPKYWGALPYTAGPAYLGVFICLFGILGFVLVKTPMRWGLLAATMLGLMLSWGKNFVGFNMFAFENFPLYNKFRAPSFAQLIPQVCVGIMAALAMQYLLFADKSRETLKADFKKILYTVGGVFAVLALAYIALDYSAVYDGQLLSGYTDPRSGSDEMVGRVILSGIKEDRRSLFGGQILRTLGFAALAAAAVWLYARKTINGLVAASIILVISTAEITLSSKPYLDNDLYVSSDEYQSANFVPNSLEQQIMQDKDPNFRVLNMLGTSSGSTFSESRTSYFFKSVGGYHPAKLRIYQDIYEKYFSRQTNPQILNMLNTKYIITQSPFTRRDTLLINSDVYGNCWFVKSVQPGDKVQIISGLGNTNLRDTAWVEKSAAAGLVQPQPDSLSTIRMTKFDNDAIEYEADCKGPQFAVFSEIYYPKGWNAYLDGKLTPYYNTNYILRGMSVPAGKHTIRFVFEPESVKSGNNIMFISSILIAISLLGGMFMGWKKGEFKS